ncbi:MAG: glycosyltransferase family 4 protein [Vicinamibacterales bacterium]
MSSTESNAALRRGSAAPRGRRVCHLVYSFYDTDYRVRRYATALARRGDHVDVIALRRRGQSRDEVVDGCYVSRLQTRSKDERGPLVHLAKVLLFLMRAATVVALRHAKHGYDIVHVHNLPDFLVFAALVPGLTGARVILDIHDAFPELYATKFGTRPGSHFYSLLLWIERVCCRVADHVIVANHIWGERIVARSGIAGRLSVVLNCPELSLFQPHEARAVPRGNRVRFVYPGSLSAHQGLETAIKAFAIAAPHIPDAEFHIYGEGPSRPSLESLTSELGLNGRVRFNAPVPVEELPSVLAKADFGIEPKSAIGFSNEALSTKVLEFMACGVPVILSRTLAHSRYFPEELVRFVRPNDCDALALAMIELRQTLPNRLLVDRARAFASTHAWETRVGEYYAIVDNLCPT